MKSGKLERECDLEMPRRLSPDEELSHGDAPGQSECEEERERRVDKAREAHEIPDKASPDVIKRRKLQVALVGLLREGAAISSSKDPLMLSHHITQTTHSLKLSRPLPSSFLLQSPSIASWYRLPRLQWHPGYSDNLTGLLK